MFSLKKLCIAAFAGIVLQGATSVFAQNIAEIQFHQEGKSPVQRAFLDHNTRLRKGAHFDAELLNADIKRLYQTGVFSDVSARAVKRSDGDVDVVYTVKLKPLVRKFTVTGNEKLKDSAIREVTTLTEGSPLNEQKLRASVAAVRKLYKEDGYNDARVSWKIEPAGEGEVNVFITIKENLKVRVNDVRFEGVTGVPEGELKDAIANRYSWLGAIPLLGKHLNVGLLDRSELLNDEARLRDCFLKYGYLDAKVETLSVAPLADDPEYADITFKVTEGKPYTVTGVEIAGVPAEDLETVKKMIVIPVDKPFSLPDETAAVKAVTEFYESMGHSDVVVRAERIADYSKHTVKVRFSVTPGRRYHVRQVHIVNNIYTKDKVIRRELAVQPGDPVDRNRIEVSKSRLMGMGYFTEVEAVTNNADDVNEKDVEFRVTEKDDRFNFKIGAGFSDVNSLVGMAEISSNNFDLFSPENWFYGGGQRFRLQGLFGVERMGFNVDFTEPWLFDLPLKLDLSGYWNELDYEYWSERRIGVRAGLSRKIFDDFTSITGGYKFEQVRIFDMSHHVGPETRRERGNQWVSQFSLLLDRDTRDSLINPTSGYNVNVLGAISPRIAGSSNNFYRLEAKFSGYMSFFDKAIVAMIGARAGVVSCFNRNDETPLFERYFLGGGDSLRGFSYRDVSPLDSSGRPKGGSTMLLATMEVSHPIWSFIRGAAFMDVGNTWENAYSFGPGGINMGVGYGLRLMLPMINAPIKLDLAYPVVNNQDNLSRKFRFHFNMGFTW
ncbi:MAG: outer membrane protein assembly factor BamA [Lentisphaeria bacterium]|nr:outer membrane protein assembly factor BamA [Lentisphaeria bacterium]